MLLEKKEIQFKSQFFLLITRNFTKARLPYRVMKTEFVW